MSDTAYLVSVREGEYGDPENKVIRATLPGAKAWCNENRKLLGAAPLSSWTDQPYGSWATSHTGDRQTPSSAIHYYIEPLPFGE